MAAKFEDYIVSGNYLSIQLCQAIFPHVGEIQFSGTCTFWDSWQPTKEIMVYLQDDKEMEACLSSGKILHFYGAAGPHMIGARQYFEHGVFCTELWIDTSRLPDLDTNMPNDFCNSFCRSVRRNMLGMDQTVEMKFFAMGTMKAMVSCAIGARKPVDIKSGGIVAPSHEAQALRRDRW